MKLEQIAFDGFRIGIPIPFPMKYVYCYLFQQGNHYVLIDVGFNNRQGREAWQAVFQTLGINPADIKTIYLTHFHPDHAGMSGWMQELTGAPVYMHEMDAAMMQRVWGDNSRQGKHIKEMVLEHGTPPQLGEEIEKNMEILTAHVRPLPEITPIAESVEFAGRKWKVIHTPGHSTGHICFFQEEEKLLLSGDHILDKITPNISIWPGSSQTPLHDYLHSLYKIKKLQVKKAFPAHGEPIGNVAERIDELLEHHEARLAKMAELAQNSTAFEVAGRMFANKKLTPHQWRFAIAETIAHLDYLAIENRIKKMEGFPIKYVNGVLM